ncbi:flavin reductase family protein [Amnibacterium sp.]|uniref:flavin reductase family protein n=1 Tax=Amnibacterium sp. TaxID=1872496 RepID=UPI002628DE34|nr:flavin reductase family protein [Amnibacterium sp.]MCU1473028.1 oxidoreductase [Amnibacterium sp.]
MTSLLPPYEADLRHLRRTFASIPSSVVAVLAEADGVLHALVASTFTVGVSGVPPLVSLAVQRTSQTWPLLRTARSLGISVFAANQESLVRQLSSPERQNRFHGVPIRSTGSSARFIAGAVAWFECSLWNEVPAGDHTVALLEVHALGADAETEPLVFHSSEFRGLLGVRPEVQSPSSSPSEEPS